MRLINIRTLDLKSFTEPPPPYAILSHRWGEGEMSYQDFQDPAKRHGKGFEKIKAFCYLVRGMRHQVEWAWVDTCCIDKTSSSELSEAINSMWKYYRNANCCIAYLVDVWKGIGSTQFRNSTWFKRGWTLQELLAPREVFFYNHDWHSIGSKLFHRGHVSDASLIDAEYLGGRSNTIEASIAQRMSWASTRITTREEDIAYCLMGLFDVNMPLLYGEGGRKAFLRLQKEIIQQSNDESIFAFAESSTGGVLAPHPANFRRSGHIQGELLVTRPPYDITHRGLRIEGPSICCRAQRSDFYIIKLNCIELFGGRPRNIAQSRVMICRERLRERGTFERSWSLEDEVMKMSAKEVSSNLRNRIWKKCESQVFFIVLSEVYSGDLSQDEDDNDSNKAVNLVLDEPEYVDRPGPWFLGIEGI